ncbi:GNAT family N-acetyltransferase [Burkholderia plantarii]|uniref:GNAT family N-acetyltransferase n=1 Tax=Burkholderia plantarii TaxID=41899 RepID=UPI00272A22A3|nr:GNAT family N-acetyltransferase [Burkholderia plantarii]WLE62919.1 GNAT family N-acetyltransferase [Burkholderia plantarii]
MQILHNPDRKYIEQLQRMLDNEPGLGITELEYRLGADYFVAVEHDAPLGVATVVQFFDGTVELFKLYVAPTHRMYGVGMQLVNRVIDELASRDVSELVIEIVGESVRFWEQVARDRKIQSYGNGKYGILLT